jgi:glycosyltransferase involved in cell wall biosynthesis
MSTVLPKVTFCIITYNQEEYITESIESAFNQDYKGELEYVISDDGSIDRTFEIIENIISRFNNKNVLLNRHIKNLGLANNVNYVLNNANGDYVVLADGDDIFMPSRVSQAIEYFLSHPDALIVDGGYNVVDTNGKVWLTVNQNGGSVYTIRDLSPWREIWCNGCCRTIRRELISLYPDLNNELYDHDLPIIARALMANSEIHIIGEVLVNYRIHENNLTNARNIRLYKRDALFNQYMDDFIYAKKKKYIPTKRLLSSWLFIEKYRIATILLKSKLYVKYIQPFKRKLHNS